MIDKIKNDLKDAMKAGDALRVSVLRMLISEMNYKKIDLQKDLSEEDAVGVVQKEVKKRREAIDAYKAGGRMDQAESEKQELEILQTYLPEQMGQKEIEIEIEKILKTIQERDFGQVMRVVSPLFRGKADGKMVAEVVRKLLDN